MVELNQILCADCMEILKDIPDNYFELAIVDPPYGGGVKETLLNKTTDALETKTDDLKSTTQCETRGYPDKTNIKAPTIELERHMRSYNKKYQDAAEKWAEENKPTIKVEREKGGTWAKKYNIDAHRTNQPGGTHKNYEGSNISNWDIAPPKEYFEELFRVSQNQIIWGGNYFDLPPTRCFLIWEKLTISENFTMAMCEYAWTSFNDNAKLFKYAPQDKDRFHPTQKPLALYEWVISKYAKEGDKILDTHSGSGTCCLAAYNLGHEFLGTEIDEYYCTKAQERLELAKSQMRLF